MLPARGGTALAEDERARRQIAEALVLAADEDADDSHEIAGGQEVDEPEHVANGAREESHWAPVRPDDPKAVQALPRRAAGREDLEQDVVGREDEEARDGDRGDREPSFPEHDDAADEDRDQERRLDHEVD